MRVGVCEGGSVREGVCEGRSVGKWEEGGWKGKGGVSEGGSV